MSNHKMLISLSRFFRMTNGSQLSDPGSAHAPPIAIWRSVGWWCRSIDPLAPEGLDGVEACGLPGGVDAEDDTHRARKADGHHERVGADQGGPRGDGGDAVCAQQA